MFEIRPDLVFGVDSEYVLSEPIATTRARLASLPVDERCDPSCPGWVIDAGDGSIQRCDECCHAIEERAKGGSIKHGPVTDDDVAMLPEAQHEMVRSWLSRDRKGRPRIDWDWATADPAHIVEGRFKEAIVKSFGRWGYFDDDDETHAVAGPGYRRDRVELGAERARRMEGIVLWEAILSGPGLPPHLRQGTSMSLVNLVHRGAGIGVASLRPGDSIVSDGVRIQVVRPGAPFREKAKYLTVLAVVEVPEAVTLRSDDDLLADLSKALGEGWPTHEDAGRFTAELAFASVHRGVSDAAAAAGAEPQKGTTP